MLKSILLKLLKIAATDIIRKYRPQVVGITGSVGKSSAKEAIRAVLASKYRARANYKNYNNEVGLPLTVIGCDRPPGRSLWSWVSVFLRAGFLLIFTDRNYPEILILEMGADRPGDIVYLTSIAPCTVGVLTSISEVHVETFKNIKKIIQEKTIVISHLPSAGFAVLNFDNDLVRSSASKTRARVLSYGFAAGVEFQATDVKIVDNGEAAGWPAGINFKLVHAGSVVPIFLSDQLAEHLIYSVLAGVAVGSVFGINAVEAAAAVENINFLPGHMRLLSGIKRTLLIDDTYNSSPEAAKSALIALSKIKILPGALRYAVLGDMLELGDRTEDLHREIGFKTAELGIDFLITIGEASKHTAAAAGEAGLPRHQVASFADSSEAGKFLQEKLRAGDVVLVKGSQGMRTEKVVREVMAEPLLASVLLVRQGREWQGI